MNKIIVSLTLAIFSSTFSISASSNTIIMGYKDKSKLPLIADKTDDSGLYKELFSRAAEKIGYELKIIRIPKARVHKGLKDGTIDFYPGASFSTKRGKYLYYLPNGLTTKEVVVTLADRPELNSISDMKGKLLVEIGSSKAEWKYPGLKTTQINRLPMDTVIKALKGGRGDFYIADIEVIDY